MAYQNALGGGDWEGGESERKTERYKIGVSVAGHAFIQHFKIKL